MGNGHRVSHMISVAVRDQDQVGANLLGLRGGLGVPGEKRVDQHLLATGFDQQARMSKPANSR